jgi:hypothetical protein
VKLYPSDDNISTEVDSLKIKKVRFELDSNIYIKDRQTGQQTEISDGLNAWFEPPIIFNNLPVKVQELFALTEAGKPQKVTLTYYISTKTDAQDPTKIIQLKRIAQSELGLIKLNGPAPKTGSVTIIESTIKR